MGLAILAVSCLYFFLYLKTNITYDAVKPEFIIAISWIAVGLLLMLAAKRENRNMTGEEQELRVFGERFARKGAKYER